MPRTSELNNRDIYVYALNLLHGAGQYVDVEDIYVECWRLSPSRFGWRKHNYPNYKTAAKAQQEFERVHPEMIIKTPDGRRRQLTNEGTHYVRSRLSELERLTTGVTKAPALRSASHRMVVELEKQALVRAFLAEERPELTRTEVAQILRCAPDSRPSVWCERLATMRSAVADDERKDLATLLDEIERLHPEWFGGIATEGGQNA